MYRYLMLSMLLLAACQSPSGPSESWRDIDLTDVRTKESFRISDFEGKTILLESFAVWCPTCTKQQKQVKDLHSELGSFVSISIDVDSNEDREKILEHMERNGFDWRYAISPPELTQELIAEFGVAIANPPSSPVILICPDRQAHLLESGVKTPEELEASIEAC